MTEKKKESKVGTKDIRAVLFRSVERFEAFQGKLEDYGIPTTILDFQDPAWMDFDYSGIDMLLYYPSFKYSSNHPLALQEVYDHILFLHSEYPHIQFYPDPELIKYYNDKYRQFLFLSKHGYPIPKTIPLLSPAALDQAEQDLGYPMVLKNRYGAGGGSVFQAFNRRELEKYYRLSTLNLFNLGSVRYFMNLLSKRLFYYHLIKEKKAPYLFLSPPLLAQEFVHIHRDLKTVVGGGRVVEGHWRIQADKDMWKMNIDGGGIGEWSYIPEEAVNLSARLAEELKATWINLDIIESEGQYLITEFSPVWHHYAYQEKESFVYKDDYNIDIPLDVSLDLERILIESLCRSVEEERKRSGSTGS